MMPVIFPEDCVQGDWRVSARMFVVSWAGVLPLLSGLGPLSPAVE